VTGKTFSSEVERIAREVAAPNAAEVDREARFPVEAIDALKEIGGLSALIPEVLGGRGIPFGEVAAACFELGQSCGAAAMVFAMHQIQVSCIVRHLEDAPWFEEYLRRVAAEQRLIASATSEVGTGGELGKSVAAVVRDDDGSCSFEKKAPTVSYGGYADDVFTTLRRSPDADPGDQVVVLTHKEQMTFEQTGTWDPLGMRGTCSPGFVLRGRFPAAQILSTPFQRVSSETMVPVSHVLWSQLWLGSATDAFERAHALVRAQARPGADGPPPAAIRLSHLLADLSLLRAEVSSGLQDFLEIADEPGRARLATFASALRFNTLKIAASEQAPHVCEGAMGVCGIAGFKNDTPFAVGRQLRDTMSARLMIANERIHQTNAGLLLIAKEA
jgi:acyl-CoA dehydrogenase